VRETTMQEGTVEPTDVEDQAVTAADDITEAEPLVEEELLVEEISIDGMCGVY
jgi:mycofactocin precursor